MLFGFAAWTVGMFLLKQSEKRPHQRGTADEITVLRPPGPTVDQPRLPQNLQMLGEVRLRDAELHARQGYAARTVVQKLQNRNPDRAGQRFQHPLQLLRVGQIDFRFIYTCLLYTSDAADEL